MNLKLYTADALNMEVLEEVPLQLWSDVADACDYATFFHTPAWANLVAKTYPHRFRIATRAFCFGDEDWAILPMMETEHELHGFFRRFSSNPFGVYGGLISAGPLRQCQINQIAQYLQSIRVKRINIFGNPYAPPELAMPGWNAKGNFTQVLCLDHVLDEQQLLHSYSHLMRDHIRRAKKAGYTCHLASNYDEVKAYVAIYQQALERYGEEATGRQHEQMFLNIFRHAGDKAKFWLAGRNGQIGGGVLAFYHRRHCVAWHAAFADEDLKLGIAKFLHHQVMLDAWKNGYSVYDFNPSGGHEGTVKFKELFGAATKPFLGYQWQNGVYTLFRRVRDHMFGI